MTSILRKASSLVGTFGILALPSASAAISTFEDLSLAPESYYSGSDGAGGFTSGGSDFENSFTDFGGGFTAWDGFAYSNTSDVTTPGFGNQYSAYPGAGAGASANYGVGYTGNGPSGLDFQSMTDLNGLGIFVANTTYAALSMLNGDSFAKKFGGADGTDPDWLLLTVTGVSGGSAIGTVDFYLADYRFANSVDDYVIDDWSYLDLSRLGAVEGLRFSIDSSDKSGGFISTPTYFAIDDIGAVPESSSGLLVMMAGVVLLGRRGRG